MLRHLADFIRDQDGGSAAEFSLVALVFFGMMLLLFDVSRAFWQHMDPKAQQAFPAWRATPVEERVDVLLRAADAMRRQRLELAAWEVLEAAKPWREADADVCEAIDFLVYYAHEMRRLAAGQRLDE